MNTIYTIEDMELWGRTAEDKEVYYMATVDYSHCGGYKGDPWGEHGAPTPPEDQSITIEDIYGVKMWDSRKEEWIPVDEDLSEFTDKILDYCWEDYNGR